MLPLGPVMGPQNPTHHVFVGLDTEGLGQVLGDLGAAKTRIAPFEFTNGPNQVLGGPFGTGLILRAGAEAETEFTFLERTMKAQQGGRLKNDGAKH